jgi:hypothetical protein
MRQAKGTPDRQMHHDVPHGTRQEMQTMPESDIIANQKQIIENQKTILSNQQHIQGNQETIKADQEAIKKNQATLDIIVKNQEEIVALLKKK